MTPISTPIARGRIVTANRLTDGAVVYYTPDGRWSRRIEDAAFIEDETEQQRILATSEDDVLVRRIVGPYAMDVAHTPEGVRPLSERERIRATGPSVQQALCAGSRAPSRAPTEG